MNSLTAFSHQLEEWANDQRRWQRKIKVFYYLFGALALFAALIIFLSPDLFVIVWQGLVVLFALWNIRKTKAWHNRAGEWAAYWELERDRWRLAGLEWDETGEYPTWLHEDKPVAPPLP